MLDMSREAIDFYREDYPGVFSKWDESRARLTVDEVENDGPNKGRILCLVILFNLHGERQKQPREDQKHDKSWDKSEGEKVYKIHQVFITDVRTEATKVGGEELISEFYTLVDGESL